MAISKDLIIGEIQQISGVDTSRLFDIGLISEGHAKKWVIKQKYFQLAKTGRTYTDIKNDLSVEFDISVSSIEKLVYRKTG